MSWKKKKPTNLLLLIDRFDWTQGMSRNKDVTKYSSLERINVKTYSDSLHNLFQTFSGIRYFDKCCKLNRFGDP